MSPSEGWPGRGRELEWSLGAVWAISRNHLQLYTHGVRALQGPSVNSGVSAPVDPVLSVRKMPLTKKAHKKSLTSKSKV
jgi:hypothetical protein